MPSITISPEVLSVSIEDDENSQTEAKIITLTLRYEGAQSLEGMLEEGEHLDIELPSHAPPPTP